jgi:DNA polymerase I
MIEVTQDAKRILANDTDWFASDKQSENGTHHDDTLDFDLAELVATLPEPRTPGLNAPDFQPDEVYLALYEQLKSDRRQEQEAIARARAAQRAAASVKVAPPAPVAPPPSKKPTVNVPPPAPSTNGKVAPRPVAAPAKPSRPPEKEKSRAPRSSGLIVSEHFKGTHFPTLDMPATSPVVKYEVVQSREHLEQVVDKLLTEKAVAVDTETNGLDPFDSKLLLIQVATPELSYIVDAQRIDSTPLQRLFGDKKVLKILQNAKFDYEMLKQQTGLELVNIYDTMLAEKLLTAGLKSEVNLAALTRKYTGATMDKATRKTFIGAQSAATYMNPEQLNYAAKDTLVLFPIYVQQLQALKEGNLLAVADLEFQCVAAVGDLELAGVKIDTVKWRKILADVELKRDQARHELMEMLPSGNTRQASMFGGDEYTININSGLQIIAEFGRLGITLEDTSEATLSKQTHPAAKKLLEYRGYEKTLGSFGEGLLGNIRKQTGRIHPDFLQYGADTGRFSCSNPNVQQIPATSDFRSCFVPQEGYKMITSDYSQAELRILAELSQDEGFLEAFRSGGDLHILAASQMFNIPVDQVTKEMRGQAKAINFGLAYGMGAQGLALRIGKTPEEADALIKAYFKAFNGVQKWLEKAGRDSVNLGYSLTPLGRKRYFNKPSPDDMDYRRRMAEIERQGKNAPIQGANADITKMALVFLRDSLKKYDARVVNTVHDEIVVEVIESQAEEVCKLVEEEMIRAGKELLHSVAIKADAKIGDCWSK